MLILLSAFGTQLLIAAIQTQVKTRMPIADIFLIAVGMTTLIL